MFGSVSFSLFTTSETKTIKNLLKFSLIRKGLGTKLVFVNIISIIVGLICIAFLQKIQKHSFPVSWIFLIIFRNAHFFSYSLNSGNLEQKMRTVPNMSFLASQLILGEDVWTLLFSMM